MYKSVLYKIIIYEPLLDSDSCAGAVVEKNLKQFKNTSSIIVANRRDDMLNDVKEKIFTRDLFSRD